MALAAADMVGHLGQVSAEPLTLAVTVLLLLRLCMTHCARAKYSYGLLRILWGLGASLFASKGCLRAITTLSGSVQSSQIVILVKVSTDYARVMWTQAQLE